jgi:hypothetical protein
MRFFHFSIIIIYLLSFNLVFAQDTIIKKNGDKIIAKVTEVNQNEIKYKRFDLPDGPDFVDSKGSIQAIIYANGYKEVYANHLSNESQLSYTDYIHQEKNYFLYQGKKYNQKSINKVLMSSTNAKVQNEMKLYNDYRRKRSIAYAGIPFAIGAYYSLMFTLDSHSGEYSSHPQLLFGSIGLACLSTGIIFPVLSKKYHRKAESSQRKAIEYYNQSF